MSTFHQFFEKREHNIDALQQPLTDLAWMIGVDKDEIKDRVANMGMDELMGYIKEFGLSPASIDPGRFAAMMKMYCLGNV